MNIKRTTTFVFVLAIAALITAFSACDQIQQLLLPTTPQMEDLSGEVPIGVVLSITGRLYSSFGKPIGQGFELALEEINNSQLGGRRISFIIEDDRSTVEGAVEAFNKLIQQDGVPVILGPATSTQTKAAFPIAKENQVVALSSISAARDLSAISDFVFRAALTTDVLIPSVIEATQGKLGYKKMATMYDGNDVFSTDSDEAVREVLAANGIEVLITETFQGGDTDFSAQLTRIKEANPDAIFVSALPPEKPGILIQAREIGIPTSVPFVIRSLTGADAQTAGPAAEGAITFVGWTSTTDTPGNQAFIQNYSAKYGIEPNPRAAQSYASVYILAKAIADAQSTDSTAIRDAMANITDFDTVLGKFSFNVHGDAIYNPQILIVANGQLEIFK